MSAAGDGSHGSSRDAQGSAAEEKAVVVVPASRLSREALDGLLEEYVTRDGTDYGPREHTLEEKKHALSVQLERSEVVIVFDVQSETCGIVRKDAAG